MKKGKGDLEEGISMKHEDQTILGLKFRELFENSGTSIVILDERGIYQLVNSLAAKQLGHKADEIAGRSMFDFLPHETATKYLEKNRRLIESCGTKEYEDTFQLPTGNRTFLITDQVLKDQSGKGYAILSSSIDITERKQTEEALRKSESLLSLFMKHSPIYIFIKEVSPSKSLVIKASENFYDMVGIPGSEMEGKSMEELFPKEFAAKITADDWDVVSGGKVLTLKEELNGRSYTTIKFPISMGGKNLLAGYTIDITDQKRAEVAIRESEERFRKLLQDVHSVSVQGYSPDGTTQYWNNASEKLYGYTGEEALGRNLLDLIIPPEMRDDVKSAIQQMAETGQPIPSSELSLMRKDGSHVSVFSSHTIVKSPGKPQELFCIDIDLTERKQAEEEILKSKQQYDNLVSKIPVGVYILRTRPNGDFALEYASPRMAEMLDLSVDSLLAHRETIFKAIHPDDLDSFIRQNLEGIHNMRPFDWKGRVVVKGDIKWLNISSSPEPLESGETLWHGLIVDITDRMRNEAEIKLKNDELITLNATKDKFFSIIAHDLKSPFNSILGLTNYMVEQIQEKHYDHLEEYATVVKNSSQQAMDLLTNLLDWSRSQTGRMEFKPERVEIVTLIKAEVDLLSSSADQKSIILSDKLSGKTMAFVDRGMFSTIMRNLISNAIKFTRPGGRVEISLEEGLDFVKISVSDNGVGIKKDRIDKLFRISENYSTVGTLNEKGTGLGLILCNEFVEKHNGKIWVESEEEKGSTFHFTLPLG